MTKLADPLVAKARQLKLQQIRAKSQTLRGGVFISARCTTEEKLALLDYMEEHNYQSQSDLIRAGLDAIGAFDVLLMEEDDQI